MKPAAHCLASREAPCKSKLDGQQLSVDPALDLNAGDAAGRELRLWPANETRIQTAVCIACSAVQPCV